MNSFYNKNELKKFGFRFLGNNVFISKKCSIYGAENISIGNNVRIDDFCILSGDISIGNYVHISAFNALYGKYGIKIGNFCGISPRCTLLSATDDFSGEYMISPMVDFKYTNLSTGLIKMCNYTQIGTHSIIMPNITINEGAICGALSFVNKDLDEWSMYKGIPAKKYKDRSQNIKKMAETYYKELINE